MHRLLYFVIAVIVLTSSCTIQKRVHQKGWHISWNKNYKASKEQTTESEEIKLAQIDTKSPSVAHDDHSLSESALPSSPEDTPVMIEDASPVSEIHSPDLKVESKTKQKPQKSSASEKNRPVPLGGPFAFFGIFASIAIVFAIIGIEVPFLLGALAVALAGLIVMVNLINKSRDHSGEQKIRPGTYYNSVLFIVLLGVFLALFIGYGGLADTIGIIIAVMALLIIGALIFLVYTLRNQTYVSNEEVKAIREKEQAAEKKELTPKEKKKQRIAAFVVAGFALAIFLAIGLLG